MSENELPEHVGYKHAPKSGRFVKGKSGNPKGRPKGSKNLATIVLRESRQPVRVNGPRGSRSVTKAEAAVMQLSNKAAQGDLRAQRELLFQLRMAEEATNAGVSPLTSHEKDQKVLENIRRRMESISAEAKFSNPESKTEESK